MTYSKHYETSGRSGLAVSGAVTTAFGLITGGFWLERVAVDTLAISGATYLLTVGAVYLTLSLQTHTVQPPDSGKITGLASHLDVAIETYGVDLSTYRNQLGGSRTAPHVEKATRAIEEANQMLGKASQRLEQGDLIACLEYFTVPMCGGNMATEVADRFERGITVVAFVHLCVTRRSACAGTHRGARKTVLKVVAARTATTGTSTERRVGRRGLGRSGT